MSLYRQGEHSAAELADLVGVARSTVHRALQGDRLHGVARRRTSGDETNTQR